MSFEAKQTAIPQSLVARLSAAARYAITGVAPDTWFGPQQPPAPQAPAEVKGRQYDYPFGVNLNYAPRSSEPISFGQLRALADALPLLRTIIETRKDQVAALSWAVRPRASKAGGAAAERARTAQSFLARPDRRHTFDGWLRMLLEDMLVVDAACVYPRLARDGSLYALDVIDGTTITPLIGDDGRSPEAPDPAYQQVLHGVPAADFTHDELLYLPRNVRSHRLYGFSPVEQVAMTVNIALRRDAATLEYYNSGSVPDAFATLPKEWTPDQIRTFQDYFDSLLSGNLSRRRMLKFVPSEFRLIEARQPPLKDQYDEWLARIICYAFSVPATPFVSQVNRATSSTMRVQATQEGLVPLKAWIKSFLDLVVQSYLNLPDCEFVWVGDDAVDPLQQAQTLNILVGAGIKTREEARADLGLTGPGPKADAGATALGKYNPNHDEAGLFTTAENAVAPGGRTKPQQEAKLRGVQVASRTDVASDVVADQNPRSVDAASTLVAEEGEPPDAEPDPDSTDEEATFYDLETQQWVQRLKGFSGGSRFVPLSSLPGGPTYIEPQGGPSSENSSPYPSSRTLEDAVAPGGQLPGEGKVGRARTMPSSVDPDMAAWTYTYRVIASQGLKVESIARSSPDELPRVVFNLSDDSYITLRPTGSSGPWTSESTATVEFNSAGIRSANNGTALKLKFPKK